MKPIKNRLWAKIFIRVAIIFVVFVAVIAVANSAFLYHFFLHQQKDDMVKQMKRVSALDLSNTETVTNTISEIADKYRFDVEIFAPSGQVLFTTYGNQIMDFLHYGDKLHMNHNPLIIISSEVFHDGVLEFAESSHDKTKYLVFRKQLGSGDFAELRLQNDLLKSSANTASDFIFLLALICLIGALIWSYIFAKKFAQPITQMRDITKKMSQLQFGERLNVSGNDEISELTISINDMSAKLNNALETLEKSNKRLQSEIEAERRLDSMRREFVANVSHELKTPIAIIQGYAEGLKLNINEEQRDSYCDTIMDESARMNRLVLSLLQLSKYESGQTPLNLEPFDISTMVREIAPRIISNKAEFVNRLPDCLPVYADSSQIEQVLKCYLENAVSHVDSGGQIEIRSTYDEKGNVRISVENTGSKVDPNDMPLIWQSFYRGDKSHKRDKTRFGLGLSIVSAIMSIHGKECGVFNTKNGVCFWFTVASPSSNN